MGAGELKNATFPCFLILHFWLWHSTVISSKICLFIKEYSTFFAGQQWQELKAHQLAQ
jgi:hypothetical protein